MSESRTLLLIGMGVMGRPYVAAAHARDARVVVVDDSAALDAARDAGILRADDVGVAVQAGTQHQRWYEAASRAARDHHVDAVVGFSEPQVLAAGLLGDELDLPGPGLHAVVCSRDKAVQRAALARHGVRQPAFHLAADPKDAAAWAQERGPVVWKPVDWFGSVGVRLLRTPEEVRQHAADAGPGTFLLEEYLPGPEGSCEALVDRGEVLFASLTDKTTGPEPYFVEVMHQVPGPRAEAARPEIESMLRDVVDALRIRSGMVHLEYRHTDDGPAVIEVAVRTAGDTLMDLMRHAWDVDPYAVVVDLALGIPPQVRPRAVPLHAATWYMTVPDGVVTSVEGVEEARGLRGTEACDVWVPLGTDVHNGGSSFDRVGLALVVGTSPEQLEERLSTLRSTVRIRSSPARLPAEAEHR